MVNHRRQQRRAQLPPSLTWRQGSACTRRKSAGELRNSTFTRPRHQLELFRSSWPGRQSVSRMAARLVSSMACAARSASYIACKPLLGQLRAGLKPPASRTSCCRQRLRRGVLPATVAASRRPEEDEGTIEKDELTHELTPGQEETTRELTLSDRLQVSSQPGTACGACSNCCLARGRSRLL